VKKRPNPKRPSRRLHYRPPQLYAYDRGVRDAHAGHPINPYKRTYTSTGLPTWGCTFANAWEAGYEDAQA
jgi:hypothetical protein